MGNKTIQELMNVYSVSGDLGVEIEVEGNQIPPKHAPWNLTGDNSLRGPSGEYVLRFPMSLDKVIKAIDDLAVVWEGAGFKAKHSIRAGVHVHVNCQDMTQDELWRFVFLYYSFETVLTNFCGPNRAGNHFCLRFKDAEYLHFVLDAALSSNSFMGLSTDQIRYSSLNFVSLFKYGSLEFRAMETEPTLNKTKQWCRMLLKIKQFAVKELKSVGEIPEMLSYHGPSQLLSKILGEDFELVDYPTIDVDIMSDFRNIQMLLNTQLLNEGK